MRDKKKKGTYRGGEGTTPVTTACPQKIAEGKTSYELGWEVKVIIKKVGKNKNCTSGNLLLLMLQ